MKTTIMNVALFLLAFSGTGGLALANSSGGSVGNTVASAPSHVTKLPAALRPALYRALAKDAGPAYSLNKAGCAVLSRSNLKACFDSGGAHFSGAGLPLALHLVAFGRGDTLSPVKPVRPAIHANHVNYSHGNLTEWWRVLPLGFEQGFTLAKRPSGNGELALALTTNNKASRRNGTLRWGRLRYGGLVVTDANGKVVPATLKSKGGRILIAVNDAQAAYPLTVDPLVWLEQKVAASDGESFDTFGWSVALAGTTALVGAPHANSYQGTAYVFAESDGSWAQTANLTASDGDINDQFGTSVALSGTTALVGAPAAAVNGDSGQGAAYVFSLSDGTWNQTAKLTASDGGTNDKFGTSVSISGTAALVGAPAATVNGHSSQGAAYVFSASTGTWGQTAKLTASNGVANDQFGSSVAIDGATALAGVPGATVDGNFGEGAAYVFDDEGGTWGQTAELTASDGAASDSFGFAVTLDGTIMVVGAPHENGYQGAAYVFTESDGNWAQTAKVTASDGLAYDQFGYSVALSGTSALIGAECSHFDPDLGDCGTGAAYMFVEANDQWAQIQKFVPSDDANGAEAPEFGEAVALDGATGVVGTPFGGGDANVYQGVAYLYGESDLGLAVSASQTVGQGQQYTSQTIATNDASVASPAVSATISVPAAASFVSANATQGSCSEYSGVVTCDFGPISANAGTAMANVTLKATGDVGETIENTASIAKATPPLSASAPTTITAGGACPDGYTEYDGSLNAGERAHSPIYQAPAGMENAILTGPTGFQLYAVFQNAQGRKIFRIPGNEVHRWAPAGAYTWAVKAGDTGGAYTLCVLHP